MRYKNISINGDGKSGLHERPSKYLRIPNITSNMPNIRSNVPSKFHKRTNFNKQSDHFNNKNRKPLIKTVKESDGSVNIIMK